MFKTISAIFKAKETKNTSSTEQVLWDYLDKCGIEFRDKKEDLINKYGSRESGWSKSLDYCELKAKHPFIEHLAHPIVFQFRPRLAQDIHATTFQGYIRKSDNAHENYDLALTQLTNLFGQGTENSVSNTSHLWQFGLAKVKIFISPPNPNTETTNSRHLAIPGSSTECAIYIETAYCPAPTSIELSSLESIHSIKKNIKGSRTSTSIVVNRTTRKLSEGYLQDWGKCPNLDKQKNNLIRIIDAQHFDIVPVSWIKEISYEVQQPAKGHGGIYFRVIFQSPAQRQTLVPENANISKHRLMDISDLVLTSTAYTEDEWFDIAKNLSEDLNVPFSRLDTYDC